jgi:hypothetical protein
VNAFFGNGRGPGLLMRLLPEQVSLIRVLEYLSGAFMSGHMIFFSVIFGAGSMSVGCNATTFSSYLL